VNIEVAPRLAQLLFPVPETISFLHSVGTGQRDVRQYGCFKMAYFRDLNPGLLQGLYQVCSPKK